MSQITTSSSTRLGLMHLFWGYSKQHLEKINKQADNFISSYNKESLPSTAQRCSLTMKDGCELSGIKLTHPEYTKNIVVFPGMAYYPAEWLDVWATLHKTTKANVTLFSYRGTTHEEGVDPREEILIQDGVEIVQDLVAQGISQEDISLYGISFGGGISLLTGAKLAEAGLIVDVINERSFCSFLSAVQHIIPLVGPALSHILQNSDLWKVPAEEALSKLQGRLIVLYHPNDYIVQNAASLKQVVDSTQFPNLKSVDIIEMKDDTTPWWYDSYPCSFLLKGHCRPLNTEELEKLHAALTKFD